VIDKQLTVWYNVLTDNIMVISLMSSTIAEFIKITETYKALVYLGEL
jgi:hypothetical protein